MMMAAHHNIVHLVTSSKVVAAGLLRLLLVAVDGQTVARCCAIGGRTGQHLTRQEWQTVAGYWQYSVDASC